MRKNGSDDEENIVLRLRVELATRKKFMVYNDHVHTYTNQVWYKFNVVMLPSNVYIFEENNLASVDLWT